MLCPTCGEANRDDAAFCRQCGRLLLAVCPRCRSAVSQPANFCDACGSPLSPAAWGAVVPARGAPVRIPEPLPLAVEPAMMAPDVDLALERFIPRELLSKLKTARHTGAMAGERRVVTMLFCDIKGSTALAEQLDPEEWTEIVNGAFEQMVRPIFRYEGTVARLTGDGLLAFFGAPIAHEDDPSRALLAGLEIVAGVHDYRAGLPPAAQGLDVRIGINTGLVVVGVVGSNLRLEYSALGDAINVAARMEQTAEPGTVQVTQDTLRLVDGLFEVEALGGVPIKGKNQPVAAYRVLRRLSSAEGGRSRVGRVHAPLVNRALEWEMLRRAFDDLAAGRGGILFLSGDAGLGKTRLLDEAISQLGRSVNPTIQVYEAAAFSYETGEPFGLLIRLLRRVLSLRAGDPPDHIRTRILEFVGENDDKRRVLESLFGVAGDDQTTLEGESFARQLVACMEQFWREQSAAAPIVCVLDDLQWADASSVDLLAAMFSLAESRPILFLGALRRDRQSHGWRLREKASHDYHVHFMESVLHPLTGDDSKLLLTRLLGEAELPPALRSIILDRAEGNPLFVEEVVQNLIERGQLARGVDEDTWLLTVPANSIDLPGSLQALLTARIDRLDEAARRTLQIASVLGRSFRRSALLPLVEEPASLDRRLLDLQRLELLREISRRPEPEYAFSHAVTHEATYNTILLKDRRRLHSRVAETLEEASRNGQRVGAFDLARHYLEAGEPGPALPYLVRAAESALRLNATAETIEHAERALPIALTQGATGQEIAYLYTLRGRALELQSRFPDADAGYQELERLALERSDKAMELEAVIAQGKLRANVTSLYDPVRGRELMERALALARELGDKPAEVRILWNLVNIERFDLQALPQARINGERALAMARELGLEEETAYLLNDLGDIYGTLGELRMARQVLEESHAHWRSLGNEPMLADSLTNHGLWNSIFGDLGSGLALVEESYAINARISNIWGQAYSGMVMGMLKSLKGDMGEAVQALETGIDLAHQAGFIGGQILGRSFLANLYLNLGDADRAVSIALEGVALGREHLPQFASMCLTTIALAYLRKGEIDEATQLMADPILKVGTSIIFTEFDLFTARIMLSLALNRPEEALDTYNIGLRRVEQLEALMWRVQLQEAGAHAFIASGQLNEGLEVIASAVTTARAIDLRGVLWRLLLTQATLLEAAGDPADPARVRAEAREELAYVAENTWPEGLRRSLLNTPEAQRILGE